LVGGASLLSSDQELAQRIKSTLFVLNVPMVKEMAIFRGRQQVYSDLAPPSSSKLAPFTESFMLLGIGDNLSLSLDTGKIIVISKISERTVLIIVTDQRIGTVLVKLKEVIDKYGKEIEEQPVPTAVKTPKVEIAAPEKTVAVAIPTSKGIPVRIEVAPAPSPPSAPPAPSIETFMAPTLVDKTLLKNYSGDEKKILSLCTGRFSIAEISKKTKIAARIIIEIIYRFAQDGTLELREEKKTGEEEAVNFLKGL
jgi:hypothetical protein